MSNWLLVGAGIIGTLLGTVFGSAGTQYLAYRRESAERLGAARRIVYVTFLTELNDVYRKERKASRAFRDRQSTAESLQETLHSISPAKVQGALETIRLIASDGVAACGARLWRHIRREIVPEVAGGSVEKWESWKRQYWALRREFIDSARREIGLPRLNWASAGVKPADPE